MSIASFCSSLPARPYGFKDGRGTTDLVRLTAKPPAQACRRLRWNKYHCAAVAPSPIVVDDDNSSLPPPPIVVDDGEPIIVDDDEIDVNLDPFMITYKSPIKRLGRFKGAGYVPASLDSHPNVMSKDVVINIVTGVSVRIYLPKVAESPAKKLPVLVYFHGGAFIVEDTASPPYHNYLNRLAARAGVLIVSVNYRLAPEHRLPAAYDDCMEALKWVVSHSTEKGQEPVKVVSNGSRPEPWIVDHGDFDHLFLSGDSAGGNITHNLAIRADAPDSIEGIALVHPYFFGSVPVGAEVDDRGSLSLHNKLWPFIAPKDSEGMDDPRVNPWGLTTAPSLKGLKCKKVAVFVAGADFHADRARMYADKLTESGWGEDVCWDHPDVGHVFHLSVEESGPADATELKKEESETPEETAKRRAREADEKMMTQLVAFYNSKPVVAESSPLG